MGKGGLKEKKREDIEDGIIYYIYIYVCME